MWPNRGDRYIAYSTDTRDGKQWGMPIYNTNSAKGMRDRLVSFLVTCGEPYRYTSVRLRDTVNDTYTEYDADNILDWRI